MQYLPDEECGTRLYQMAPERTLYVFSTSKLLAGGLRLGVLRAPVEVLTRIGAVLRSHSWMVAPLLMETVCAWLTSGNATQLVEWQMEEMRERQRLARTLLTEWSPAARPSSFDLWLELPEGQRIQAMVASLAEREARRCTMSCTTTTSRARRSGIRAASPRSIGMGRTTFAT